MAKSIRIFNKLPIELQQLIIMHSLLRVDANIHKKIKNFKLVSQHFKQDILNQEFFIKLIHELLPSEVLYFKPITLKTEEQTSYWQKMFCELKKLTSSADSLLDYNDDDKFYYNELFPKFVKLIQAIKNNDIITFKAIINDNSFDIEDLFVPTKEINTTYFRVKSFNIVQLAVYLKRQKFLDCLYDFYQSNPKRWSYFIKDYGYDNLHLATILGQIEEIKKAIHEHQNIHIPAQDKKTPIVLASLYGHDHIVSYILQNNFYHESVQLINNLNLLYFTIRYHYQSLTNILLSYDVNTNLSSPKRPLPIWVAAYFGDCETIEKLLEKGSTLINLKDPSRGTSALWIAVEHRLLPAAKILLSKGANVNTADLKHGASALWIACDNNDIEMARLLLAYGANVDQARASRPVSPLIRACELGNLKLIHLLLDNGAHVNFVNKVTGETPLYQAIRNNEIQVVKLLLANGAKVNHKSKEGLTPIELANQHSEEIKKVLENHNKYPLLEKFPDYKLYLLLQDYLESYKKKKFTFSIFNYHDEFVEIVSNLVQNNRFKPWRWFNGMNMIKEIVNIAAEKNIYLSSRHYNYNFSSIIHWAEYQFNFQLDKLRPTIKSKNESVSNQFNM